MVASLTAPPSSEVIRSLKLFQGHDGASGTEDVAEHDEYIVEKNLGHTTLKKKPTTTELSGLPKSDR